jgi:opacity protein-like surface antigen
MLSNKPIKLTSICRSKLISLIGIVSLSCMISNAALADTASTAPQKVVKKSNQSKSYNNTPDIQPTPKNLPVVSSISNVGSAPAASHSGWFVGIGVAKPWYSKSNENSITTSTRLADYTDILEAPSLKNNILYEATMGYQFSFKNKFLPYYSLGLLYQIGEPTRVNGLVDPEGLGNSGDASYQGQIVSQSLFINNQWGLFNYHHVIPYLEAGLGIAQHELKGYQILPASNIVINNGQNFAFAWLAGGGLAYELPLESHALVFNLGVRYMNLGSASAGSIAIPRGAINGKIQQNVEQVQASFGIRYLW